MFKPWGACLINDVATVNCIPVVVGNVINAFLLFSGTVSLFLIAYAAIRMITSGGEAKQVASARQIMTYAIIGLIIVLSSFAIVFFIGYITKSTTCITDLGNITKGC